MLVERRPTMALCFVSLVLFGAPDAAVAQAAKRDAISDFLKAVARRGPAVHRSYEEGR